MGISPLSDDDYVDLWKYFEARAESLKESMFQIVTWVLGFASAVLGFVLTKFINLENSNIIVRHRGLSILSCFIGLALCAYALLLLFEYAAHIQRNWNRANECKKHSEGLTGIINNSHTEELPKRKYKFQIWHKVGGVVCLFALAFILIIFLSATA